ncbi:MAG: phosphatase PAP2 family protein [Candidatus Gracilibacteria bacterium]
MKNKLFYIIWAIIGLLSFFFDFRVLGFFNDFGHSSLDGAMVFLTDFGLLFVLAFLFSILFEEGKWNYLILIAIALFFTADVVFAVKFLFQVPRPYDIYHEVEKLGPALGYSFPSLHTALVFAALPFFRFGRLKYFKEWWFLFCVLIGVSRLYVGVHNLSDAVWGGLIGFFIGDLVYFLEGRYKISEWFLYHIKDKFELRRQVMHMVTGLGIAFALYLGLIGAWFLVFILCVGLVLAVISRGCDIPLVCDFLDFFERPSVRRKFPGMGSFFMVLGSLFAVLLFQRDIAIAAIIIMAIGDSVTNIIGRYFGEIDIPWNREKQFEGPIASCILSFLGAMLIVGWLPALVGSVAGALIETFKFKIWRIKIDDNLIVPVMAGGVMEGLSRLVS